MQSGIESLSRWIEAVLAVLLIGLMLAVVLQVLGSAFDVNPILSLAEPAALVGRAVTLNSLLDLQWHLLVIVGLIPAGLVWQRDRHVRVDFLYQRYDVRWRAKVDLAGNLLFAAPFFLLILPASWSFMMRAWRSDEGSRNGGLEDLWLIKSVLPLGLGILAVYILLESLRLMHARR
ncbi:TRAP transporter small permease subunit [Pelagibius sp.]|uniref:TRAP transporter small permease subunit n=1 Tax=Pelagibius sp. TaxID=1931238 RepID=UPI00261BAE6D|nr:TRAP transporter small permease subunit [Pelagibius sp.]